MLDKLWQNIGRCVSDWKVCLDDLVGASKLWQNIDRCASDWKVCLDDLVGAT